MIRPLISVRLGRAALPSIPLEIDLPLTPYLQAHINPKKLPFITGRDDYNIPKAHACCPNVLHVQVISNYTTAIELPQEQKE